MDPGSKVYFIDMVIDKNHEFYKYERYIDIEKWSMLNGKVRPREELEGFFERNGLRVRNMTEVKTDFVIETELV